MTRPQLARHFPNGMMGQVVIENIKSFMKYALDSVFFFRAKLCHFFGVSGFPNAWECIHSYLGKTMGVKGRLIPDLGSLLLVDEENKL